MDTEPKGFVLTTKEEVLKALKDGRKLYSTGWGSSEYLYLDSDGIVKDERNKSFSGNLDKPTDLDPFVRNIMVNNKESKFYTLELQKPTIPVHPKGLRPCKASNTGEICFFHQFMLTDGIPYAIIENLDGTPGFFQCLDIQFLDV